jgi:hypothetical protein
MFCNGVPKATSKLRMSWLAAMKSAEYPMNNHCERCGGQLVEIDHPVTTTRMWGGQKEAQPPCWAFHSTIPPVVNLYARNLGN